VTAVQLSLLDGERRRDRGLALVSQGDECQEWLRKARDWAERMLSYRFISYVTANDVRGMAGDPPRQNLMGAVFKDKRFEFCGWELSSRGPAHARALRRWRLKDG